MKYGIGDLIIIVAMPKIGIIYDIWQVGSKRKYNYYKIYWTYKDGFVESASVGEGVIDNWLRSGKIEGERTNELFRSPCEKHQKQK